MYSILYKTNKAMSMCINVTDHLLKEADLLEYLIKQFKYKFIVPFQITFNDINYPFIENYLLLNAGIPP